MALEGGIVVVHLADRLIHHPGELDGVSCRLCQAKHGNASRTGRLTTGPLLGGFLKPPALQVVADS